MYLKTVPLAPAPILVVFPPISDGSIVWDRSARPWTTESTKDCNSSSFGIDVFPINTVFISVNFIPAAAGLGAAVTGWGLKEGPLFSSVERQFGDPKFSIGP